MRTRKATPSIQKMGSGRSLGALALTLLVSACGLSATDETTSKSMAYSTGASVFVNEIHYDNDGTDSGEAIEVVGPAGTDMSAYSLALYNGANGSLYDTIALFGVLADEGQGYGVVTVELPVNGLQNGSPDGIALVEGSTVLSFLSYEGTFSAVGGPADGLTSTDIGVSESGSTPVGASLQRTGQGLSEDDFTWVESTTSSFGSINPGQSFSDSGGTGGASGGTGGSGGMGSGGQGSGGSPGGAFDAFVSEFHYDNDGGDVGEGIEIQAPAGSDLSGWSLVLYNGNNSAPYDTVALSGIVPDQSEGQGTLFFEVPGLQNGAPDGFALVDDQGSVVQFLSYEGTITAVGGPADGQTSVDVLVSEGSSTPVGHSLQLIAGTWTGPDEASFGELNESDGGEEPTYGECGDDTTAISAVQGSGFVSPLAGQIVEIEGIVVADFQGGGEHLGGFFVQSEISDADPNTSEGIFVYDLEASGGLDVELGQKVRVGGTATEYFDLTEIVADVVLPCGTGSIPAPVPLPLPYTDVAELEALEGMLVVGSNLTATEVYDLGRYGEVSLSAGGRLFNPTNGNGMSVEDNARHRILLDDARDEQNLFPVYLYEGDTLRLGDTLPEVTAALHYAFGAYRLQPVDREAVEFVRTNPRETAPAEVGGDVRVASLNVLNYFTTLNERGANTAEELERQRQKLISAIIGLDADVIGLMEIENNVSGSPVALDDLVASVNAALGSDEYARAPDPDDTGTDAIRTAIIYRPAIVDALPISLSDEDDVYSRLPIAQAFSYQGDVFSVVVNHFKSKGSCPSNENDPNADQGQGCWNLLRTQQAEALLGFVSELQEITEDQDVVVLGDLNSYLAEDPITTLEDAGLSNWVTTLPEDDRYSYVFFGESGVLDYAMTTPELSVTGVTIWHINADEPRILDYNTEYNPEELYQPDQFRSSDHDPVILGLDLSPETPQASVLVDELRSLAEAVAEDADLSTGKTKQLMILLGIAEEAIDDMEEHGHPFLARLASGVAKTALRLFERRVHSFERRGDLSESQAADLLAATAEILSLL